MIKVLVSACLLGEPVRYNGSDAGVRCKELEQWRVEGRLFPFCPELAGGLPVPRPPAEIREGDGAAVISGAATVITNTGSDVTAAFVAGAEKALQRALEEGVKLAVLTEKSPSCGTNIIYDGSFRGNRISGQGVTAALLEQHGIRVFSQHQLDDATAYLEMLELTAQLS